MTSPKVLVGCPTSNHKAYCLQQYVNGMQALTYDNFDVLLVDNSQTDEYKQRIEKLGLPVIKGPWLETAKERIVASRNLLRQHALDKSYDYLLSLEQDVVPPPDVIQQLLQHNKQIITGVYYSEFDIGGVKKTKPLLWAAVDDPNNMRFMDTEVEKKAVVPIKACGIGCILISKQALKDIPFRLFEPPSTFDDIPFCKDAEDKGYTIYADTAIVCKHHIQGMDWESIT